MFEVIIRATGKLVKIKEEDFDEALHMKVVREEEEKPKEARTVGDMKTEDFAKGIGEALSGTVREMLKSIGIGEKLEGEGKKRIDGKTRNGEPEKVERFDKTTRAYGEALRSAPGFEAQYATLPDAQKAVRSPEGDVFSWRCLRALAMNDPTQLNEIKEHEIKRFAALDRSDEFLRATMGTTSTDVGGGLVPTPLANLIVVLRDARERLLPRVMRLTTDAMTLTVPNELAVGAVTAEAENTAIAETDSTFGETVMTKQKVARLARTSKELLSTLSGAFSLSTILANQASRKMGVFFDLQGSEDGDGNAPNHKNGILNAAVSTVATVTGALTRTKLTTLLMALPSAWRDGVELTFMGNSTLALFLTNLEDSTGRPLYQGTDQATRPMSDVGNATNVVEGVPFIELPFALDFLYIGALRECMAVLDGTPMRVEMTDVGAGAFASDQLVWKFVEQRDTAVLINDGFRKSVGAITAPA